MNSSEEPLNNITEYKKDDLRKYKRSVSTLQRKPKNYKN